MKSKYKLKKKYAEGTAGIQRQYTPEEMKARQLQGTSGLETGVDSGIEKVAGSIPIASAFMGAGKALYSGIGQQDNYGVAKNDTGAAIATAAAPHKVTFGYLQDGKVGDAVGSLLMPFGFAAKRNKELRGERDALIQQQQAENNKLAFQGEDVTKYQTGQIYKTGTSAAKGRKEIEAEGGELVFKKIGNKYKLKADLKGPSHKQGGIDLTVSEGDVIVPKSDASKVRKMIGKNGLANDKFNGYRLKLPKDKPVAATGTYIDDLDRIEQKGVTPQFNINPQVTGTTTSLTAPVQQETSGGFMSNAGGYLNTAAQLAPTLYNIGQGLFGKVEKEKANLVNPELYKYQDSSDPLRRASDSAYRIDASNARNLAGGNAGNIRANLNQANVANYNRKQDINSAEVDRALQTANANTGLKNQYKLLNRDETNRVNQINSANAAVKKDYLSTGLNSLSSYAQARKDDEQMNKLNDTLAGTLEKRNYKYAPKTKTYKLKK